MNVFGWVKSFFGGGQQSAGGLITGIFPSGLAPKRGTRELLQAYKQVPWLHSTLHRIARDVANTPTELYLPGASSTGAALRRALKGAPALERRRVLARALATDELKRVEEHPFLQVVEDMNPAIGGVPSWHVAQVWQDLKGESIFVYERGVDGLPVELWPVPPHWLIETPSSTRPTFRFSQFGWVKNIAEDDVLWIRQPDPENPYARGVGYGDSLGDTLDISAFLTTHVKSWFLNRAMPDVFLSMEGINDEKEAMRFEEKLKQKHRGLGKGFQIHVANGKIDVQPVSHTFKEMQISELRAGERDVFQQIFNVPPEVMGVIENSNRATIESAFLLYGLGVLCPRLDQRSQALQAVADEWDERLVVSYCSPIPEDKAFTKEVMVAVPTCFRVDEHRALAGLAPLPNGEGQALYQPAALPLLPAGGGDQQPADDEEGPPDEEEPAPEADAEEEEDTGKGGGRKAAAGDAVEVAPVTDDPDFIPCKHPPEDFPCAKYPVLCCNCGKALGCHFEPQPMDCRSCRGGDPSAAVRMRPRLRARTRTGADDVGRIVDELTGADLTKRTDPVWQAKVREWGQKVLDRLGVEAEFDMRNPLVLDMLAEAGDKISGANETTKNRLRATLMDGVMAGEGIDDLKQRVADEFDLARGYRAEMIARTEVVGSSNAANVIAYQMSGVVAQKEWLSVRDAQTRDSHVLLDGQRVGISEDFVSPLSGKTADAPGGFGDAGEDINCRCTTLPIVDVQDDQDDSDKALRAYNAATMSAEEKTAAWKAFSDQISDWEGAALGALREAFSAQERQVLARLS